MISSECVPFAKSGGLADVVAALSRQLSSMGHDVRIILPEYSFLNLENSKIAIEKLIVPMGFKDETVQISKISLPDSNLKVLLAGHPIFTNRTGIYGEHGSHAYRDIIIGLHFFLLQHFHILMQKTGYRILFMPMTGLQV